MHRKITLEFMDGSTRELVIDNARGARRGEDGIIRFYRTQAAGRPKEIYAAPAESIKGWGEEDGTRLRR